MMGEIWVVPAKCEHGKVARWATIRPRGEARPPTWRTTVEYACSHGCTESMDAAIWPDKVRTSEGRTLQFYE